MMAGCFVCTENSLMILLQECLILMLPLAHYVSLHPECNHDTGGPTQAACLLVCLKYKEMYGRILKSLNMVNLYRGMSKLKLKINVNLHQLFCIVVSVALHGEFARFLR